MATKKRVYNKSTGRDYTKDAIYNKKTAKKRAQRNAARAKILNELTEKHGARKAKSMMKGKDVDHIKTIKSGGGNGRKNLRLVSVAENRGRK